MILIECFMEIQFNLYIKIHILHKRDSYKFMLNDLASSLCNVPRFYEHRILLKINALPHIVILS